MIPSGTEAGLMAQKQPKISFYYSSVSLKETWKMIALLAIAIGGLLAYAFIPEQVAENIPLKQIIMVVHNFFHFLLTFHVNKHAGIRQLHKNKSMNK